MKTQRLAYLDGLRGVAAVLVVIHHLMIGFYPATYTRTSEVHTGSAVEWILHDTPLGIVINGGLAVALFLLLSGYVLSLQFDSWENFSAVPTTTMKRLSRFFFLILTCNVLAWGLIALGQTWNHQAAQITGSWWWLGAQWRMTLPNLFSAIAQGWYSLFRFFPIGEFYNSSLWTMPYFFVGALLVSGLSVLGHVFERRWILYVIALILLLNSYYYFLVLGMLLYELHKHIQVRRLPWWVTSIVSGFIVFFGNYPQAFATSIHSPWYRWLPVFPFLQTSSLYHGIAACGLLFLVLNSTKLQSLLSKKWFVYCGKRSFSLYVFHVIAINTLTSFLFIRFLSVLPYSQAFGFSVVLTVPLVLAATEGLYRWVELRSDRISRHISCRLLGYNTSYGSSAK